MTLAHIKASTSELLNEKLWLMIDIQRRRKLEDVVINFEGCGKGGHKFGKITLFDIEIAFCFSPLPLSRDATLFLKKGYA